MRRIVFFVLLASAAALHAQINDSEVWVGSLDMSGGRFAVSNLMNISKHPGYDNQPAFFPDGKLVFTSQIAVLDETGHAVQAVIHDFAKGTSTPVAGALGFSPTPAADGSLMLLRDGHVVLHDASGKETQLTETKDAGYFARFDEQTWVLYMNDKQRRIVMYDPKTKALDTMALGSITAPFRIPGKRAVTFVAVEPFPAPDGVAAPPRKLFLRQLNLDDRQTTTLAAISFETSGSHVWTSRGTLLMASGHTIYEWNPAKPDDWRTAVTFDDPELQGLTRIAISARGDRIALVSTPRDETIIRDSRAASNAALASHNAAAFAQVLKDDATVVAASGKVIQGRAAMQKEIESRWSSQPDLVFVRTPATIDISRSDPAASERGSWTGHATTPAGLADWRGDYLAVWRKTITSAGLPSWTIASEVFVALDCTGAGCAAR
ncbi:MAG TPA: nuclear transport factor 2 family protein [Thermoanaerobaculia bacterium]|jgi:ketosteroid isomerase-like protein|nr:nuclear transport factor 2 family protein [Thermoanaerobaculia bacterium]